MVPVTVFGDGFSAYHFDVHLATGALPGVKQALKDGGWCQAVVSRAYEGTVRHPGHYPQP